MKTFDALLLAGSLLFSTVAAEIVVRHIDGYPLLEVPLPEGDGWVAPVPPALRDGVALASGVSAQWFDEDPPPLPNRTAAPAEWMRLFWEVKNHPDAYMPFMEADLFKAWNTAYVGDPCKHPLLRRAPEHQLFVYDPPQGQKRPPYRFLPNTTTPLRLVTNQIGWRGPPIEEPRGQRTVRIVFIGSSTVVGGHFLPYSAPEHLTRWLELWAKARKLDVRFEVLNAGRESTTSADIAEEVRSEVLAVRPDLVVYYEGGNQFDLRTVVPDVPEGKPHKSAATGELGPSWFVVLSHHFALVRRIQAALGYAGSAADGREWPKPDYKLVWPGGLDEFDPDLNYPKLPIGLGLIQRDLDQIRNDLAGIGAEFALSSFVWMVKDGIELSPIRHKYIIEHLNVALYPFRYRDVERLAKFQNRFFAKYAAVHGLPFIDTAGRMPLEPDLFTDGYHMRANGVRLQAWIMLQQLVPLIERHLTNGDWPKKPAKDAPPLPTFEPRRITFDCKAP